MEKEMEKKYLSAFPTILFETFVYSIENVFNLLSSNAKSSLLFGN